MHTSRPSIWTLGTGTKTPQEFISLLHTYSIQVVADVRRFPSSRFPYFHRDAFRELIENAGLTYVWMGDNLGGYRKGGYEQHMGTDTFVEGLARLEELARQSPVAIVCAETLPWRCHRRHIAQALSRRGWDVVHIIDEKRTWVDPRAEDTLPLFPEP
jgi:uncharacterized protein (DUF488 family)